MEPGAPLQFDAVPVRTPADGPVAVELVPAPDPWRVAQNLAHLPHLIFLDSAEKRDERGRHSYVAAAPQGFSWGRRRARSPLAKHFGRFFRERTLRIAFYSSAFSTTKPPTSVRRSSRPLCR